MGNNVNRNGSAGLSPRDRAAIEKLMTYQAMPDGEKITELERQLAEERARANKAETEAAYEKDMRQNVELHRGAMIEAQHEHINQLTAALEAANAKIKKLEENKL